ncbi:MAG: LTA synthase family protein [Anaerorhabdus sp.]
MKKILSVLDYVRDISFFNLKLTTNFIIIINIIFMVLFFNDFINYSYFFYLFILLFLIGLNLILPKKIDKAIIYLFLSIIYIYLMSQEVYYNAFEQYFLFSTAFSAKEEMATMTSSIMEFIDAKVIFVIFLIILQFIILMLYKSNEKISFSKYKKYLVCGLVSIIASLLLIFSLKVLVTSEKEKAGVLNYYSTSDYFYEYLPNTNVVVGKFGKIGLLFRDSVERLFIHHSSQFEIEDDLIVEVLDSIGKIEKTDNKYTGIFKDKSLVIIQAESLMNAAIDKDLTPTLYNMRKSGLDFTNFNAPLLYGSTSDTEFMANTGLFPVSTGEITFDSYNENSYVTTLAKIFSREGYYSSAYHSNYANFYSRDKMYPNMGYEFFDIVGTGLKLLEKDSVTLDRIKWIYNWADKYLSYFITYNGHQPYNKAECGEYPEKYYEKINDIYPNKDDNFKCYMAKNMDLDKGLERYVEDIKNNNYEVVIAVFGDHYAKGLKVDVDRKEAYTPFFIWSKDITSEKIDKRTSTLDILPTLANMFDVEYDRRTVFGTDIMDESYEGFYFNSYGHINTNDILYDPLTNKITLNTDKYTEEEASEIVNQYILRMNVARTIVETDFFKRFPNYGLK